MRRLFLRIFLPVFFALLVALSVGFVTARWLLLPPEREAPPATQPGLPTTQRAAPRFGLETAIEQEVLIEQQFSDADPAGACRQLEDWAARRGIRAYLVRNDGTSVCAADVPPAIADLARRAAARGGREFDDYDGWMFTARPMRGPQATSAVLVVQVERAGWWQFRRAIFPGVQIVFATVAIGVVSFFLARYLAGPVLKLRSAVRRFADGELDLRIGPAFGRRRDELAELGRDFDRMAARIATLVATQRRLLQDISHELRSPLTRQIVALELARRDAGPAAQPVLSRALREAERLNELVQQLLTLTRLEAAAPVDPVPIALAELVRQVVDDVVFEVQNSGRAVRLTECAECRVVGTPELIRRAVENVLRNAVVFTPAGTCVDVAVRTTPNVACIAVRDHGPGVPEDELAAIFRPFYRVSPSRDRQAGGVGLGLSIAERAVRSHGGTISATNASDGGLCVEICLPRSEPAGDVAP